MKNTSITDLGELVLSCIAAKLDARSLAKLACTCKQLERMAGNQLLWKHLCCERWNRRGTILWKSLPTTGDYKTLYTEASGKADKEHFRMPSYYAQQMSSSP